jgi:hypothetical protein
MDEEKTHDEVLPATTMQKVLGTNRLRRIVMENESPLSKQNANVPTAMTSPKTPSTIATTATTPSIDGLSNRVLTGLNVAGAALTILLTTQQDVAVEIDHGNAHGLVRMIVKTVSSVLGGYWMDSVAAKRRCNRSFHVGWLGLLLSMILALQILLTVSSSSTMASTTTYYFDACYTINVMLLMSTVTDDSTMSYPGRVWFLASSRMVNLFVYYVTLGLLWITKPHARVMKLVVVGLACPLFVVAQNMIVGSKSVLSTRTLSPEKAKKHVENDEPQRDNPKNEYSHPTRYLTWRYIVYQISRSQNFRAWIGMDIILVGQVTAHLVLLRFVAYELGVMTDAPNLVKWMLSSMDSLKQISLIVAFLPMRINGCAKTYEFIFYMNLVASIFMMLFANASNTYMIGVWLFSYPILTWGVRSAGFQLAMADLAMDVKHQQLLDGRMEEPSLAAMLIAANALFCKPIEFLFTNALARAAQQRAEEKEQLLHLFVVIPLICSCLQLLFWKHYDLTPRRTTAIREDLKRKLTATQWYFPSV